MTFAVGAEGFRHAALGHSEQLRDLAQGHRRSLRSGDVDELVAAIDHLFLLCELHGDCLELLADLVDIGGGHGNEVTELSSYSAAADRVSPRVRVEVIFVNMSEPDLLDSVQVAARLGISVGAVYKLRTQNDLFPRPERYSGRSPLYSSVAIDEFMTRRSNRGPSTSGRRPRLVPAGVVDTSVFAERLRQSIADGAGAPEITTQAQLIDMLGLNVVTFGQRMRGRTSWKDSELEFISKRLAVDVSDANDVVNAARAAR